jgi:hypothetical protein
MKPGYQIRPRLRFLLDPDQINVAHRNPKAWRRCEKDAQFKSSRRPVFGPALCGWTALIICMVAQLSDAALGAENQTRPVSIDVKATCEALVPAYCQGAYGFHLSPGGEWRAGPSPEGRLSQGRLTRFEQAKLRGAVDQLGFRNAIMAHECGVGSIGIPGVMETVAVSDGVSRVLLRGSGGRIDPSCGLTVRGSAFLFKVVDHLMRRHYPKPF